MGSWHSPWRWYFSWIRAYSLIYPYQSMYFLVGAGAFCFGVILPGFTKTLSFFCYLISLDLTDPKFVVHKGGSLIFVLPQQTSYIHVVHLLILLSISMVCRCLFIVALSSLRMLTTCNCMYLRGYLISPPTLSLLSIIFLFYVFVLSLFFPALLSDRLLRIPYLKLLPGVVYLDLYISYNSIYVQDETG